MKHIDELFQIRDSIVNKALVIGYLLGLLSYFTTLFRAFTYGFDLAFVIITIVVILFGVIVFYRKKLSLQVKIYSVMIVVLMALITGLSKFGFLVSSKAYLILIPVFVSFILDFRRALISLLFYGLIYLTFGYLFISGTIPFNIDANKYVLEVNSWLMDVVIILLTAFALLYVSKIYSDTILDKLTVINGKNKDLAYREKMYRYLFENSLDAIVILKDKKVSDINERGLELFGCERKDIVGRPILEISSEIQPDGIPTEEKMNAIFDKAIDGKPIFLEWECRKLDGENFLVSVSMALMKQGDSELYQAVIKDITEKKKQEVELKKYKEHLEGLVQTRTEELEQANVELTQSNYNLIEQRNKLESTLKDLHKTQEKLIESEKMAFMGIFTAGIAHEINNPLNYIQSGLYSLKNMSSGQYDELPKEEIEQINDEIVNGMEVGVERINNIVQSLERFNKKTEKDFFSCNIRIIIENCLNILAFETIARIKVIKKYPKADVFVEGNESELHHVFMNILYNAVQAINNEGEIKIEVSLLENNNEIKVEITDNGVGMSDDVINRVFEPFFTTKKVGEGTGLGLSTVYNIINKHGGEVKVKSKKNIGTTFSVIIPQKS